MKVHQYGQKVSAFINKKHALFIDGERTSTSVDEQTDVYDPATGAVISRAKDIDLAVAAARKAFDSEVWWGLGGDATRPATESVAHLLLLSTEFSRLMGRIQLSEKLPYTEIQTNIIAQFRPCDGIGFF